MKASASKIIAAAVCFAVTAYATVIEIPGDYPTIQDGIDFSVDGDTILVQPDVYFETLNYNGKNVIVASLFLTTNDLSFIHSTFIDADSMGTTVLFENSEGQGASLVGFTIVGGLAAFGGGILCTDNAAPSIKFDVIRLNAANQGGGGIACVESSSPLVQNCVIYNNFSASYGGGIYCSTDSKLWIVNSVICGNQSMVEGGGLAVSQSVPIVFNCIFWNNCGPGFGSEIYGTAIVTYSDVPGGWSGEGNIDEDPQFRNRQGGDFHIMSTACGDPFDSPCIDAGDPSIDDILLDCSWGLGGQRSDMGAFGGRDPILTAIDDDNVETPGQIALIQNYPNPFNAATNINYELPYRTEVRIDIYNIVGQKTATLFTGIQQAGNHVVTWHADDIPSGVYFARLEAGQRSESIKMVLLR